MDLSKYLRGDKTIWTLAFLLALISLLSVYSIEGLEPKHFLYILVGFGMMYITHLIKYTYYAGFSYLAMIIAIILMILTLFQPKINEASRALSIGVFSFQPADFAKIALIIFLARFLSKKQEVINDLKQTIIPALIAIGGICVLTLRSGTSTTGIIFISSIILLYVSRVKLKYVLLICFGAAFVVLVLFQLGYGRGSTAASRFSNESEDQQHARMAVATGGVFGKMPGNSDMKYIIPKAKNDYIFSIILEEYGILGCIVVLGIYFSFLIRSILIVRKSPGSFGTLLCVGLALLIVVQAFIHMLVNVDMFPSTGQTLPLISLGGSSYVFTCIAIGIILSISAEIEKEEKQKSVESNETPSTIEPLA